MPYTFWTRVSLYTFKKKIAAIACVKQIVQNSIVILSSKNGKMGSRCKPCGIE